MGSLSVAHASRARFSFISGVSRFWRNFSSVFLSSVLMASMYSWYDFWRYFSICLPSEGADGDCAFTALVVRRDSKRTKILRTIILPDAGWGNVLSCPFLGQVQQMVRSFIRSSLCRLLKCMEKVWDSQRFSSFLMDKYWILVLAFVGKIQKMGVWWWPVLPRCGFVMGLTKCHHWQIAIFTLSKLLYFGSTIRALGNKRFTRGLAESLCQPSGGLNRHRVSRKTVFCAYRSWTGEPHIPFSVQSVMRNLT